MPPWRLQKILAHAGVAARRQAEEIISSGRVKVNGQIATLGQSADPDKDKIELDGRLLKLPEQYVYLMMNKPPGYLTTRYDPKGRPTVMDLLGPNKNKVYPVGRLDRNTSGLLLFTNDGDWATQFLQPRHNIAKEYRAEIIGSLDEKKLIKLRRGLRLPDGYQTAPAKIEVIAKENVPTSKDRNEYSPTGSTKVRIELVQGHYRQIRQMFEAVGCQVNKLSRVRIGDLRLRDLPRGNSRPLTPAELARLAP